MSLLLYRPPAGERWVHPTGKNAGEQCFSEHIQLDPSATEGLCLAHDRRARRADVDPCVKQMREIPLKDLKRGDVIFDAQGLEHTVSDVRVYRHVAHVVVDGRVRRYDLWDFSSGRTRRATVQVKVRP